MRLTRQKKSTDVVVGLDIEAGSVAAAEIRGDGSGQIARSAVGPVAPAAFREGEVLDADLLTESLKSLFGEHKLAKEVRLGIANQRVVVRTLRLPAIEDPKELDAAIRFQAQEQMPMPLDQAVLEHQVVGGVPSEEGAAPQLDVVVVAARRDMIASFLEPLRRAGLEPVGVDLSAFAMIRALAGESNGIADKDEAGAVQEDGAPDKTFLYCNVGDVTNLAVVRRRACLFTRVSHVGLEAITARLAASRGLGPDTAAQWLQYVGLEQPTEGLEGDAETIAEARRILEEGVLGLVDELRLSLDYYGAQEGAVPVQRIVLCGAGTAIPGLPARLEGLGVPITVARPSALGDLDDALAARLTLPYGLALES